MSDAGAGIPGAPGPNFIARPYRGVSVQDVDVALGLESLREHLLGRRVYRRTEFMVLRRGAHSAVVQLGKDAVDELFVPVTEVRLLAGPDEVAYIEDERVDCANPNQMARAAAASGRVARVYVVEGRSQHVNLIVDPLPIDIRVVEVVPPEPPKLLDMAKKVVEYDELLAPVVLHDVRIDLRDLAAQATGDTLLFPCRCARLDLDRPVEFLDRGPAQPLDWTLVGCERSRQIHEALYGADPPRRVEICPLQLDPETAEPTLLKCCLREEGIERDGGRVVVPWGGGLEDVREALHQLTASDRPIAEPVR